MEIKTEKDEIKTRIKRTINLEERLAGNPNKSLPRGNQLKKRWVLIPISTPCEIILAYQRLFLSLREGGILQAVNWVKENWRRGEELFWNSWMHHRCPYSSLFLVLYLHLSRSLSLKHAFLLMPAPESQHFHHTNALNTDYFPFWFGAWEKVEDNCHQPSQENTFI